MTLATLMLLAAAARAQVGVFGPQQTEVKGVVLRCKVVCVACELQRAHGVGGHAKEAPHLIGIKTPEGLLFTVLSAGTDGAAAKPIVDGALTDAKWLGKDLDLNGRTFPKTMVIEVFRFKEVDPKDPQTRQLMYYCNV